MSTHTKPAKQRSKSAENTSRRHMVHQTSPPAALNILKTQTMLPGKEGAIFFARSTNETEYKAKTKGTYLLADVYLGHTEHISHKDLKKKKGAPCSFIITEHESGDEFVIQQSGRVKNIRYLDGILLSPVMVEMRNRMPLIYATTAKNAAQIIHDQKIHQENRKDIAGYGIYLWENIPDARIYSLSGKETFLVADVYFINVYHDVTRPLPNKADYDSHDTFRGDFNNTHYYMVKRNAQIKRIHYIGGVLPPKSQ